MRDEGGQIREENLMHWIHQSNGQEAMVRVYHLLLLVFAPVVRVVRSLAS